MHGPHAGGGLLFAVVAALLAAPLLFALALFNLAGPSTRAALAGDELPESDPSVALIFAGSSRERPDDIVQAPLAGVQADDGSEPGGLAPVFEPRVGRFRLDDAAPPDDGHDHEGHAHDALGEQHAAGRAARGQADAPELADARPPAVAAVSPRLTPRAAG